MENAESTAFGAIEKYGSDYMMKKEITAGRLFQKSKGIYSDEHNCSELDFIVAKYPRAIFTGENAFYYYGLTDVIPEKYVLATKCSDSRVKSANIHQVFVKDDIFEIGKSTMEYR